MKPATSALNDWIQRIVVHPEFIHCPVQKDDKHCATIQLGNIDRYDFIQEHYVKDYAIDVTLSVFQDEIGGKFQHAVRIRIQTPSCFLKDHTSVGVDFQTYYNITLKNIFEFNKMFKRMFCAQGRIGNIYGIPCYKNIYHRGNSPKLNFESYVKEYEKEFEMFNYFKDSLFSYLYKCSQINAKKKNINKDFIKG